MLSDSQGNPLVDDEAIKPQVMNPLELTCLVSGIIRTLVDLIDVRVVERIAVHADAVERGIREADHPPVTDEDIARWEAPEEEDQ